MKEKIEYALQEIAKRENIEILYAVESGSRAWGFPSQDSDYDVRFLYRRAKDWYLKLEKTADHLEFPINEELDICGWDLDKTLRLLQKSNPALLEWLSSPIVYQENPQFMAELHRLSEKNMDEQRLIYHYLHMAEGNYREYLKKEQVRIKKYFYVLRPVLAYMWIKEYHQRPPVEFEQLLVLPNLSTELLKVIDGLLVRKKRGDELDLELAIPQLNTFLDEQLQFFAEYVKVLDKKPRLDSAELNNFFLKWVK
ncbi:nucleotidyltransferase domain-containing protein [Enterococcus hulanensis]|uniref:nucleotidyltransferase domain-containing protein n=1 Tax=Enterococcus hulanensis TaxID=2559929 RepID=UPI00288D85D9|nr:nucleotidyltransferase domain-containing protein [Enterococcus hulanensis]MDT2659858.1 nucleotidyltransferase domain-containing protein [Enterococcus hulanensis]